MRRLHLIFVEGIVCAYQLFITLSILIAYIINYGTERIQNTATWRITVGIDFLWAITLGLGILLFSETSKHNFRNGREVEVKKTTVKVLSVHEHHPRVHKELAEIKEAWRAKLVGGERQ